MKRGTQALVAAAILCFVVWGVLLGLGLQPLVAAPGWRIVYGEGEDFYADARAMHKAGNDAFLLLYLPHANADRRWWTVDLKQRTVARSGPPRSLDGLHYVLRGDLAGERIGDGTRKNDWSLRFGDDSVSFSGEGLTCRIRRERI